MNRILQLCVAIVALLFTCCDKNSEEPWNNDSLFGKTYEMDENGRYVLKNFKTLSKNQIYDNLVGYGWKVVGTYEITSNGKLSHINYWDGVVGGSPTDFWFETIDCMTAFFVSDAPPALCFQKFNWSYDNTSGFITRVNGNYMQVLKITEKAGLTYLYTIQKICDISDAYGNLTPVYGMIVYQRMSEEELANKKDKYTYKVGENNEVPDNCKFYIKASYSGNNDGDDADASRVFKTFRLLKFELVDRNGINSSKNAFYDYYDSIVWKAKGTYDFPDRYVSHSRKDGVVKTAYEWSSYFFNADDDLVVYAYGYKGKNIVFSTELPIYVLATDGFFGCNVNRYSLVKPKNENVYCAFDKSQKYILFHPRLYNGDKTKNYSDLSADGYFIDDANSEKEVNAALEKMKTQLVTLMKNCYGNPIASGTSTAEIYKGMFNALPDNMEFLMVWETEDLRMALVRNPNKDNDTHNSRYYIHAEPRK